MIVADYALFVCMIISFYMVFRGISVDMMASLVLGFLIAFYALLVAIMWIEKRFSI
jgi:hypothetical protein